MKYCKKQKNKIRSPNQNKENITMTTKITVYDENGKFKKQFEGDVQLKDNSNYRDTFVITNEKIVTYYKLAPGEHIQFDHEK